jgi:hypothetical protein
LSFSIGAMLALALIAWQVLGLPEVEDPFPDRIGLGSIVGRAGVAGMRAGVLRLITRPSNRDRFVGIGTLVGLCFGIGFYALSLIAQLVFGP